MAGTEQRQHAIQRFGLNVEDFQWRHEEVVGEGGRRITIDEYLDIAVFYTERHFSATSSSNSCIASVSRRSDDSNCSRTFG